MYRVSRVALMLMIPLGIVWGYVVDYSLSEFSFYKENGFDRIKATSFAFANLPGAPDLPAIYLNYIIPATAHVESIIITDSDVIQLSDPYYIFPAQKKVPIGGEPQWTPPDSVIYNRDELFPGRIINIASEGIFDGARIVTIEIRPLQYRPKSRNLYLYEHISFEFVFVGTTPPDLHPKIRGRYEQAMYDGIIDDMVTNSYEVPSYYQKPAVVEEKQLLDFSLGGRRINAAPYVIITDQTFVTGFQPYANWLTEQGIPATVVTTQNIYQVYSGIDKAEQVKNYIIDCWQHAGGTYFILGGDDFYVPVRWCVEYVNDEDTITPCDLYFSDLTGDWDANGNLRWGEMYGSPPDEADRWPEVFVGRISTYQLQEVQNWVIKALHYEKNPGVIFNTALWIYQSGVGYGDAPEVFPGHFTHQYCCNYYADAALNEINQGNGILNINCHGNAGDFTTYQWAGGPSGRATIYSWWADPPSQTRAGVDWLSNLNKFFVGYAISCYVGAFDSLAHPVYYPEGTDTCIADAFVDAYLGNHQGLLGPFGACAFLCNTRNGLWVGGGPSYDLQYAFWERIFMIEELPPSEPSINKIGVAEAMSKCDHLINWNADDGRYVCYCHTLFGSPYFESWTKTPGNMLVSHPSSIPVGRESRFTVTVTSATLPPVPLQYAKVCLYKGDDIYEVGTTDGLGRVTFIISPQTLGNIKVTVTRLHNLDGSYTQYRPSETYCAVVLSGGGGQASESHGVIPSDLCLMQIPTIFRNNIDFTYGVPVKGDVSISVCDITGSKIQSVKQKDMFPGYFHGELSAEKLASGVYFIVLKQGDAKVSKKILFIK